MVEFLRQTIRQGDVLLIPIDPISDTQNKLDNLILAHGEVTGHAHQIREGKAELFERDGTLYLRVLSNYAVLSHEEHHALKIAHGSWMIRIQREYFPRRSSTINSNFLTGFSQPNKQITPSQNHSQTVDKNFSQESFQSVNQPTKTNSSLLELAKQINSQYWDNHIAKLEKQKDALARRKAREEKEKADKQNQKNSSRLNKIDLDPELRRMRFLISNPLKSFRQQPTISTPVQPQPTPSPTHPNLNINQQQNWRNVVD
jgi:hypothetical protein